MADLTGATVVMGTQATGVQGQVPQTQVVNQGYQVPPAQQAQNSQALFTQEQLNSIIQGRVNPLNQRIAEMQAQLAQAQQLSQSYLNELTGYKNKETVIAAGVPAQYADFVAFEAGKLAVNGKSFADAVKEYTTVNAQFVGVNQGAQSTQSAQQAVPPVMQNLQQTAMQGTSVAQNQQVNTQQPSSNGQGAVGVANVNTNAQTAVVGSQAVSGVQMAGALVTGNVAGQNAQVHGTVVGQVGGSSFTGVSTPQGAQTAVDAAVDAFLRGKGIRK